LLLTLQQVSGRFGGPFRGRRLHAGHRDHGREHHKAGERVEAVVEASRAVLDPTDEKGTHKTADIADGVDQRHSGRGAGQKGNGQNAPFEPQNPIVARHVVARHVVASEQKLRLHPAESAL
jgi:hypothetical protein